MEEVDVPVAKPVGQLHVLTGIPMINPEHVARPSKQGFIAEAARVASKVQHSAAIKLPVRPPQPLNAVFNVPHSRNAQLWTRMVSDIFRVLFLVVPDHKLPQLPTVPLGILEAEPSEVDDLPFDPAVGFGELLGCIAIAYAYLPLRGYVLRLTSTNYEPRLALHKVCDLSQPSAIDESHRVDTRGQPVPTKHILGLGRLNKRSCPPEELLGPLLLRLVQELLEHLQAEPLPPETLEELPSDLRTPQDVALLPGRYPVRPRCGG